MRISDWSSDVCSSDLPFTVGGLGAREMVFVFGATYFQLDAHLAILISLLFYLTSALLATFGSYFIFRPQGLGEDKLRSEEHTSELQSLMRISYAVFCLKKTKTNQLTKNHI